MNNPIVEFTNVSKKYPGQVALKDVSFSLPQGKIIGIVGPNGSGKSTSLKLMAGLIHPSSGTVMVKGQPASRRIAGEVSYLSELDSSYPFFTVAETIAFYASLFNDLDQDKAKEMLEFMKLSPTVKVKNLSKGNRGRLKIVLSLSRCAPLILMDEPLSGLDPMVKDSIVKSLVSYLDLSKQTLIMTTHEISQVEPLLDMVVAIQDGNLRRIDQVDTIRETYHQSLLEWMKETLV